MVGDILQPTHLLFILVVLLLVLGPKRLPEVGRTLGKGMRDFRNAINSATSDHHEAAGDEMPHIGPDPEPTVATEPQRRGEHDLVASEVSTTETRQPASGDAPTADKHEFAYEGSRLAEPRNESAERRTDQSA